MIIKTLRANEFMKFHSIELKNLPERGEIAVIGENEAGKTTLGECIAFALFGRTVRTEETDPAQVINWNADDCKTAITLHVRGRGDFTVERSVSRSGTITARLSGPDGTVLADDPSSVTRTLPKVFGFNFPEFRYSFYVAQKEIDIIRHSRRDNSRQIVYDMLGISAVERSKSLIESEILELRQKSETLDRDLAVSEALRTSLAVDTETLRSFEQEKLRIEDDIGRAMANEKSAREELTRARGRSSARSDVLGAFDRFQASFLRGHTQLQLASCLPGLEAIASYVDGVANDASRELMGAEKAYQLSLEKITRLRKSAILVKELSALIGARHAYLTAELRESSPNSADWSPSTKAEFRIAAERRAEAAKAAASSSVVGLLVFGVLGLILAGAGGAAVGGALPLGDSLPMELKAQHVGLILLVAGVSLLITALIFFLRRGAASADQRVCEDSLGKLRRELEKMSEEAAACAAFREEPLSGIEALVRRINNQAIKDKFQALQTEARELLEQGSSVDKLLEAEVGRELEQREARDKLSPRLGQANRLKRLVSDLLDRARPAVGETSFQGGASEAVLSAIQSKDLTALEACAEELSRRATQSLMTLDAMSANTDAQTGVGEAARRLQQSLVKHFELAENSAEMRGDFESRSQLPRLLDRSSVLELEAAREALQHEAKLLGDILGDAETLNELSRGAESQLQKMTEKRIAAENERVALYARSESMRSQMSRNDELTVKIAGLQNALAPITADLSVRKELIKLLDETCDGMKTRFGPNIAKYIELLLPRITSNRYRRVQISPDLDIKVYSSERADYVRLIDLSFGTSDQILLALRLGLAQALVQSRGIGSGEQFMFLDEPLAAFDEERSQAFLQIMRTFDDNFAQIFVSSTTPIEGHFDKVVNLSNSTTELIV